MAKPIKMLLAALLILALLGGAGWFLLSRPPVRNGTAGGGNEVLHLAQKTPEAVARVDVENQHGAYTVTWQDGACTVADLPAHLVNGEYVQMLRDEASSVQYTRSVTEDLSGLADYGLDQPEARVDVTYTDGSSLHLLLGAEEPVGGGRYLMEEGGAAVLLMKNNRSIRFTMPVEKYLNYIIIPPENTASELDALQDIAFSGRALDSPIVLKAVLPERADMQLTGLSFGAVTHVVVAPGLHEANATTLLEVAEDLLGLISEGVVDYNCTKEELAAYGFDDPYLCIEFDYKNGADAPVEHYRLLVSQWEDGYIVTLNDDGVVYRILDLSFLHVEYQDFVLRWFLSPFISDVQAVEVSAFGRDYRFEVEGDARNVAASYEGQPLDSTRFRAFYNLLVSAACDGAALEEAPQLSGEAELAIRYIYRNREKDDDVLALYTAPRRRLYVQVNGVCEFTMRQNFLPVVEEALQALTTGRTFKTEW